MPLPLRILEHVPTEPVISVPIISVDGAWGAPGLNLSHWPGNTTPPELRHDLSTGSALAFVRLSEAERADLAAGCTAIANNHVDTDGVCALFTLLHPELALPREDALLAAARAGDFFQPDDEDALVVDAVVTALLAAQTSPWARDWTGLDTRARHEDGCRRVIELLPALLDGEREPWRALWEPALQVYRRDLARLSAAQRDDLVHFDLTVWTGDDEDETPFTPGRHALLGESRRDRVLVVGRGTHGTTYRLILSTLSWFDLVSIEPQPRPDLTALAARLDALEGDGEHGWQAQPVTGASPELWFGAPDLPSFPLVNDHLRPSRLDPDTVRREVIEALRACFVFPED